MLCHSFPVLSWSSLAQARCKAGCPTAAGTPGNKLLGRCSHKRTQELLLSCSPPCEKAIVGSTPNDNSPVSAMQGALGCYPKMHGLLLVDSCLAVPRAPGSCHDSHKHEFVLLIHLRKTDASKGTKEHLLKEKLSERNFMNVTQASPLIIF